MGAEFCLYLKAGHHSLIARMTGHDRPQIDQDLDLVLDTGKLHFFDPETEKAVV
jgi:multiple sugar transport system ATP-binding protein